jgi:hypothetical protein
MASTAVAVREKAEFGKPRDLAGVRQSWAYNALKKRVAANADAARAHEANGLPHGHMVYQSLYNDSVRALREFGERWGVVVMPPEGETVTESCLIARFPALFVMKTLATPAAPGTAVKADFLTVIQRKIIATVFWCGIAAGTAWEIFRLINSHFHIGG